jgi:hypothetical protein
VLRALGDEWVQHAKASNVVPVASAAAPAGGGDGVTSVVATSGAAQAPADNPEAHVQAGAARGRARIPATLPALPPVTARDGITGLVIGLGVLAAVLVMVCGIAAAGPRLGAAQTSTTSGATAQHVESAPHHGGRHHRRHRRHLHAGSGSVGGSDAAQRG